MNKPKLSKIIANDYIALLAVVFAVFLPLALFVCSVLGFGVRSSGRVVDFEQSDFRAMVPYLTITSAAAIVGFYARITWIKSILEQGVPARGVIRSIMTYRDRGRIEFDYEYAGHKLSAGMAVHLSKAVRQLRPGDVVDVVVSREKPTRALLRSLFV